MFLKLWLLLGVVLVLCLERPYFEGWRTSLRANEQLKSGLSQQEALLQSQIKQNQLQSMQQHLEKTQWQARLLNPRALNAFMVQLNALAHLNGLNVLKVTPASITEEAKTWSVQIKLNGSYLGYLKFLKALTLSPVLLEIEQMTLTQQGSQLEVLMNLQGLLDIQGSAELTPIAVDENLSNHNPFEASAASMEKQSSIFKGAPGDLAYLGYVRLSQTIFALLKSKEEWVWVKAGDHLFKTNETLIEIHPEMLIFNASTRIPFGIAGSDQG
ncbi:MAG: hypothetical protein EBX40_04685 [Gammaproteobacteria bacterium]|nr:hypothetical protein [Gammaproteobacteria bacterium]